MNKNYFKYFFRRITKDFKQKQLLPLKLLFFMHSSTILVLYPYLTIHMRELGINVEETAIMSAVIPVVAILMPPLAGMLADKIGNFRVMLACFSGIGGVLALLLLLVPVGRITINYPDRIILEMSCTAGQSIKLSHYQDNYCDPINNYLNENNNEINNSTELQLESCGFACHALALNNEQINNLLKTNTYGLQMYDVKNNLSKTFTYTLTNDDINVPIMISDRLNNKILKNNERYQTSIRKLSKFTFYFPTQSLFNFSCNTTDNNINNETINCVFGTKQHFDQFKNLLNYKFNVNLQADNVTIDDKLDEKQFFRIKKVQNKFIKSNCLNGFMENGQHISITLPFNLNNNNKKHLDLGSCAPRCILTTQRKNVCKNKNVIKELDMKVTFWSYLIIRVFVGIISGTSFAMFEGAVIAILREHKADYGLQRIYATIGGMISSPLSGILIDFFSRGKGYTDFRPIFFLYAALKIISGILMLFIDLEFKKAATSVVSDVITVLKKVELIALFIACLILGSAWGYIESFLFWLLQDLGGSKSLMGLTITVGGLVGIPLLVLSGPIIKKIGHANVIFIGFIFYAIRLLGYSLIYDPWLCLIFEAMEAVTLGLSFTAAVTYAAKLSTVTTDTTIQGMLGGLYYGVGKGVGSLIGGYLIKSYGIRYTFQKFALFTAFTGFIYFAFYHFYMKKWPSTGTDITKKDTEKQPTTLPQNNDNQQKTLPEVPVIYEDALTNLAYEDTENEQILNENNQNNSNNNHNNNNNNN